MLKLPHAKTKIVATIGPASDQINTLERMIRSGMNIARLNLAHGNPDQWRQTVSRIRQAAKNTGQRVAILADLPGPKLRIGEIKPDPLLLKTDQTFMLTTRPMIGDQSCVYVDFPQLTEAVRPGEAIFLNDGFIELTVESVSNDAVLCQVVVGGELRSHKGINIPRMHVPLPAVTEHDISLLEFACKQAIDAVSVSFVSSAEDIRQIREAARHLEASPFVIAKIERAAALDNIDAIIQAADGIMVARGDLGVETSIETIAILQKHLIRKANHAAKPVITATQMLESMTQHSRPTRAEATDVANAVLDGTDAVMLSEESALGKFPVDAVKMLGKIAHHSEKELNRFHSLTPRRSPDIGEVIALNVVTAVEQLDVHYVFTPTETGSTARRIGRFHLPSWTIALSPNPATCQQLLFSYGVFPVPIGGDTRPWEIIVREWLRDHGIDSGPVVITQGPSRGHPGGTNRLEIILPDTPPHANDA